MSAYGDQVLGLRFSAACVSGIYARSSGVYQPWGSTAENKGKQRRGSERKPKSSASAWFRREAARYVLCPTAFFSGFCSAKIAAPATTASSAIIEKNASFDIFS